MELKGKTAVVTGSGRGIGRAVALDLAREGCNVVLVSRSISELKKVSLEAERLGAQTVSIAMDLGEGANLDELMDRTLEKFHSLDILINNAGLFLFKPFLDTTPEEYDRIMAVNLKSLFFLSQKALSIMKEKRSGYIINVSSTAAIRVSKDMTAYGISKRGVIGLSEALYEAAKEYNVRVSTVYPGITDTAMVKDLFPHTPDSRFMLPEDISYCIMFLLKQSERMLVKEIIATEF